MPKPQRVAVAFQPKLLQMKLIVHVVVLVFILGNLFANAQPPFPRALYSIDTHISDSIRKLHLVESGRLEKSMQIHVASKTFTFYNTDNHGPEDCFTNSLLLHDTISVTGYMMGGLGWGFKLLLFKDSCIVAPFALSDGKIYKYNESDKDSVSFVILRTVSKKVILSKQPMFKEGEIVEGLVEMKSVPFYYLGFDGKFVIDLKAYFKTAELHRQP